MIGAIYKKIALFSPWVEVFLRTVYWNNVGLLNRFSTNKSNRVHRTEFVDFEEIVAFLESCGIGKGDLVVMHSSYGNLKPTSLDNQGIIDRLLYLVGENGTLAAPVIRRYEEEKVLTKAGLMKDGLRDIHCVYDVDNTPVSSGVLGITLMKHEGSVTSHFPLNPLTAVGREARAMMQHNLDHDGQSAHGKGSCWEYCADHNAWVIYLGIDFGHHITMQQVFNEAYIENTPPYFYIDRSFTVIADGESKEVMVKERRRCFTKRLAEINVREDVARSGIVKMTRIKDIPVSVFRAKDLLDLYASKRKYYPYFI